MGMVQPRETPKRRLVKHKPKVVVTGTNRNIRSSRIVAVVAAVMVFRASTEGGVDATCVQFGSRGGEEFHPQEGEESPQICGPY